MKKYWIMLASAAGAGSRFAAHLLSVYRNPEAVMNAPVEELERHAAEAGMKVPPGFYRRDASLADHILEYCRSADISAITPNMTEYPPSLLRLPDFPLVLYVKGRLPDLRSQLSVSIVGTRRMSDYGRDAAYRFGAGLSEAGINIVSGGALGIDSMAITGALKNGGSSIVVLGCGIDITYPTEHRLLFEEVAKRGAIVTEYIPGTAPKPENFPMRNRIISGLSQATVVIEAPRGSGALITARHAFYQGKDVFAVPGNVDSAESQGSNQLLREGARPATSPADVIAVYEYLFSDSIKISPRKVKVDEIISEREKLGVGARGEGARGKRRRVDSGGERRSRPERSEAEEKLRRERIFTESLRRSDEERSRRLAEEDELAKAHTEYIITEDERGKLPLTDKPGRNRPSPDRFAHGKYNPNHSDESALSRPTPIELGDEERAIYKSMYNNVPMLPEEISDANPTVSSADLLASLTILELCGMIEIGANGFYMKVTDFED